MDPWAVEENACFQTNDDDDHGSPVFEIGVGYRDCHEIGHGEAKDRVEYVRFEAGQPCSFVDGSAQKVAAYSMQDDRERMKLDVQLIEVSNNVHFMSKTRIDLPSKNACSCCGTSPGPDLGRIAACGGETRSVAVPLVDSLSWMSRKCLRA